MNCPAETKRSVSFCCMAYLKLFRIPNLFTALADVLMGFLVVHQTWTPAGPLVCLLIASACIYTAGMVLNDVYDLEVDRVERPQRPLPAGDISLAHARRLGYLMLVIGVLAATATRFWPDSSSMPWRSGLVALLLAICVLLYDRVLKKTRAAPLVMGGCRFFNVLLGMSFAQAGASDAFLFGYEPHHWMIAAGIGGYIAGVTWFARTEAKVSSRWQLGAGVLVMVAGILVLTQFPAVMSEEQKKDLRLPESYIFLLLLVLGATVVYRCTMAVSDPQPGRVQMAVKLCLRSLIFLDAAVALCLAEVSNAILLLALLLPMIILGRWFRST